MSRGEIPGPENSIGKLVGAPKTQEMASFCMDLLEMSGAIWAKICLKKRAWSNSPIWVRLGVELLAVPTEIMANIIAERVLGMPQEPRMDKGMPFSEVPTGSN